MQSEPAGTQLQHVYLSAPPLEFCPMGAGQAVCDESTRRVSGKESAHAPCALRICEEQVFWLAGQSVTLPDRGTRCAAQKSSPPHQSASQRWSESADSLLCLPVAYWPHCCAAHLPEHLLTRKVESSMELRGVPWTELIGGQRLIELE